ncbi:hypothetical protein ABZ806_41820 [Spirillospora sp. NPDC047418]
MGALALAVAAPAAYVAGFTIFKVCGRRMPRLTGSRFGRTTWTLATSPGWLGGLALLIGGMLVQSIALTRLPVSQVVPMYGPVMAVLLLVAVSNFGERVAAGELRALSVLVLALLAFAAAGGLLWGPAATGSAGPWDAGAPLWKVALLVGPSVLFPLWLFTVRDRPVDGQHAKRVTGVAFGLGAGAVVGCAESSGASVARMLRDDPAQWQHVLGTPHPYIIVVAGLLGAGLAHIGLQRCRLSVVIILLAVASKASLWLGGILVYGQPWPQTPGRFALSGIGLVLAVASIFMIPRHEPAEPVAPAGARTAPPSAPPVGRHRPAPLLAAPVFPVPEPATAPVALPGAAPVPAPIRPAPTVRRRPDVRPRPNVPRSAAAMRDETRRDEARREDARWEDATRRPPG